MEPIVSNDFAKTFDDIVPYAPVNKLDVVEKQGDLSGRKIKFIFSNNENEVLEVSETVFRKHFEVWSQIFENNDLQAEIDIKDFHFKFLKNGDLDESFKYFSQMVA